MADTESTAARAPGPELRLLDRRAFVGFPELELAPGITVTDFSLQIPDITFPLNLSGGAAKYQKKKLDFGMLELSVDAEVIRRAVRGLGGQLPELDDVVLHFRPGHLEVQARLLPDRSPVTFKVAFDGDGERLAVYLYDARLYGPSSTPVSRLGALVSQSLATAGVLPEVERRGASGFSSRLLPSVVERAAVGRGYKMPSLDQARLAEAAVSSRGLRLRFTAGGLPPPGPPDEELLLALEGARAFAEAEELLAHGKLDEARAAYLALGDAAEAHPFAVERLLTLLVADPAAHELALDIAASLTRRRPESATALWVEAVVRERRGETARAAERYLALSALARRRHEEAGAFFSAEAAARAAREEAPQLAVKALHEVLGIRPDHLPSLKGLARAADLAMDRAGAIRAYRRIAALAREPLDAAHAHVQLARLIAQTDDDVAGARLHCEAALRLSPDDPDALFQLGELCYRGGEWLRAIKALDRLREVALARHEVDRVGRANLLAGRIWETGLKQLDNALLRYREAHALLPMDPEPPYLAARVAEALNRFPEALAGYQQAVELAGPAPAEDAARAVAHASHHALARILRTRLGEPARARGHLEAALALDPRDRQALDELLPYFRAAGKLAELADACEKAAQAQEEPAPRAALLAEAGELYRTRLGQPERAEALLTRAVEADPDSRPALEGLLAIAEGRRDGGLLCRCLDRLVALSQDPKDRVRHARRLAVAARDLAFDLDLAVKAYHQVLAVEPMDLPTLGELTALERRRADMTGLSWALEQRGKVAEALGDKRLAAAALRELASVLEGRLGRSGEALVALEKSTRLYPDATTLLDLAALSLKVDRPLHARRALEDALSVLPRHTPPERLAELRAQLGRACESLGDLDAAMENYAQAFPLRRLDDELGRRLEALYEAAGRTPELTEVWAARAEALVNAGRAQDAASLFYRAARAALEAGDSSLAMVRLTAALDAAPQGDRAAEVLETMGELLAGQGERPEASRVLARRAGLSSGREAARWLFRASALVEGTPREQLLLGQALDADATYVPARLRRGQLAEATSPREALADLEAALAVRPEDEGAEVVLADVPTLLRRTAAVAARAGATEAARRWLSQYASLRPSDLDAQLELAGLHRRAGALEPLVELLGTLWPRLDGDAQVRARREYAEGALALGRGPAAMQALRAMLAEDPADGWAAARLLTLLPEDDTTLDERIALVTVQVAGLSGDERGQALRRRAELHRQAGATGRARADLHEAASHAAAPAPVLRTLAELERQAHDDVAELSVWRRLLELARDDAAVAADAGVALGALAERRTRAGDAPGAVEAYRLLVTVPLEPAPRFEAYLGLARAARALSDGETAEHALAQAALAGPVEGRVGALEELATLLEGRGARQEAIAALDQVLALAPGHAGAVRTLQRLLRDVEDWEGLAALIAGQAAAASGAVAVGLYLELARLYEKLLDAPGPAEQALRRVVALEPDEVHARLSLARLVARRGEPSEAVSLVEEAARRLEPEAAASELRWAAGVAGEAGDDAAALGLMRAAHALVPATGADLRRLAGALYLKGAVKEALPLQAAVASATPFEEDPEAAEQAALRLADLAEQAEDFPLAERTLRRVVAERPLSHQATERLARLVARRDPHESLELLAAHLQGLAPSDRVARQLAELARRAMAEHGDAELAARLLSSAADQADEPLPLRRELAALFRHTGQWSELIAELDRVGQLSAQLGDVAGALGAWDEAAGLAEGNGRVDDALTLVGRMAERCEGEDAPRAAALWRRQAELYTSTRLDLEAAHEALERAWAVLASPDTARAGVALARRRDDRQSEIDWHERLLSVLPVDEQAAGFVELARLHLGLPLHGGAVATAPLDAPDQAEAALRRALELDPGAPRAEALLLELMEHQGRVSDVAAWYEDAAARAADPRQRAELLLGAAQLYRDRADRPHDAAAALLAARAAVPEDLSITERVADLLLSLGRRQDAADFEAVLLDGDPFHRVYERHAQHLRFTGELMGLAALVARRAGAMHGDAAAVEWLSAADTYEEAGAAERALLCESRAFDASPEFRPAFERALRRAEGDVRRLSDVLLTRARAVADEAHELLLRRARLLSGRGDTLRAAAAWDDVLAVAPCDVEALSTRAELAAQASGPRGAQPFDRRLVQLEGVDVPAAQVVTSWLRLGLAALESRAFRDAAQALERVQALDPDGPRAREALPLLAEAYGQLSDVDGQYRTTMKAAAGATGPEADALVRRAAALYEDPSQAHEAWSWLASRHPADVEVYRHAVRALSVREELPALVQLHARHAAATGGPAGARALLDAATTAASAGDAPRAYRLRLEAAAMDPRSPAAAEAVLADARARGDAAQVERQLERLMVLATEDAARAHWTLELADALQAREAYQEAKALLLPLKDAGHRPALEALERVARATRDTELLAEVQARAAEALPAEERAARLLEVARTWRGAGQLARALALCRQSLGIHDGDDGHRLEVALARELGQPAELARALSGWAPRGAAEERPGAWLEAARAARDAGDTALVLEAAAQALAAGASPRDVAVLYAAAGDAGRALEVGFGPAMSSGDAEAALALADAAQDGQRAADALAVLAVARPDGPYARRYLEALSTSGDAAGLLGFAARVEGTTAQVAAEVYEHLAGPLGEPQAVHGLARLGKLGGVVDRLTPSAGPAVLEALLGHADGLGTAAREALLTAVRERVPARARSALRALATLYRDTGRSAEAARALGELASREELPPARAALHLERAVLLHGLGAAEEATRGYERALVEDPSLVAAVAPLVELYAGTDAARFVAMAERLAELEGDAAVEPYRAQLVDAHEALGRPREALALLAGLPESPATLERRVRLAEAVGLFGDALQAREKLAKTREAKVEVLGGYLRADLIPFAARMAGALLADGPLPSGLDRLLAERLSPWPDGAAVAAGVWPRLLAENPVDADGWTLYARALEGLGREEDARLADGFGAALTDTVTPAPPARSHRLGEVPVSETLLPFGCVDITAESMPRLHRSLSEALEGLGVAGMGLVLDPRGGAEASVAGNQLVLGAGALARFAGPELTYLMALALCLGTAAAALKEDGPVPRLEQAAVKAFHAYPASLAACRVVAALDVDVRSAEPESVDVAAILRGSPVFRALARAALERLASSQNA